MTSTTLPRSPSRPQSKVDWQFVDDADAPPGPWRTIITTQGVTP